MIANPKTRRRLSVGLIAFGAVLFFIAPENAWVSLVFAGLGVLLEVIGIRLGHSDRA
jgi:energy-converting hydrogenase Eha subunit G